MSQGCKSELMLNAGLGMVEGIKDTRRFVVDFRPAHILGTTPTNACGIR
jgi:hypothetical protein